MQENQGLSSRNPLCGYHRTDLGHCDAVALDRRGAKFSFVLIWRSNAEMAMCVADYYEKQFCP